MTTTANHHDQPAATAEPVVISTISLRDSARIIAAADAAIEQADAAVTSSLFTADGQPLYRFGRPGPIAPAEADRIGRIIDERRAASTPRTRAS